MTTPTQQRLKELFDYEPDTGKFKRKISRKGQLAGTEAGCIEQSGYIRIQVDGKAYRAHRLAWLYVHGFMPEIIDHINGNRSDNRMTNIRQANQRINNQNRHSLAKSASGLIGVSRWRKGWRAKITDRKKQIYIGTYATPEEAHLAYLAIKKQIHEGAVI